MYVYLKLSNEVKCFAGVTLKDAYMPVVCEDSEPHQLEPAIWFKTLIIDSVLIDCDNQEVRWSRANITESCVHRDLIGELGDKSVVPIDQFVLGPLECRVYEDGDCYDFDPQIDELFDAARKLVQNQTQCMSNSSDFHTEILRLLHCYILPAIKLTTEDKSGLQMALSHIEKRLEIVSEEIMTKDNGILIIEKSLQRQRERLFGSQDFHSECFVSSCDKQFVMFLLKHLEKDIGISEENLTHVQAGVNALKESSSEQDVHRKKLSELRQDRDKNHEMLNKMRFARETIKNSIIRPERYHKKKRNGKKKRKIDQSQIILHDIYLEVSHRWQKEKEEMHNLCLKKVKISSVRESVQLALEEIRTEGETVGKQVILDGGVSVTDVLPSLGKPQNWRTLEEKVSALLADPNCRVCGEFHKFCNVLHDRIGAVQEETRLFSVNDISSQSSPESDFSPEKIGDDQVRKILGLSSSENDMINSKGSPSRQRRLTRYCENMENSETLQHTSAITRSQRQPYRTELENMKEIIKNHIQKMCMLLVKELPEYQNYSYSSITGKLWVCYESHLYGKVIERLGGLYELAYEPACTSLSARLSCLSLTELGIDESWLLQLASEKECNGGVQPPDAQAATDTDETCVKRPLNEANGDAGTKRRSRSSVLSIALEQMTLNELYQYANKDAFEMSELVKDGFFAIVDQDCEHDDGSTGSSGTGSQETVYMQQPGVTIATSAPLVANQDVQTDISEPGLPDVLPSYTASYNETQPPSYEESEQHMRSGFLKTFQPVVKHIDAAVSSMTVLGKLKQLTKAFRFIGNEISNVRTRQEVDGEGYLACCDEILTVIIVLLTYLDGQRVQKLYAHLNLMIDLMAPFMMGSVHDCSLTNFLGAFQYLFERKVLYQSKCSCYGIEN